MRLAGTFLNADDPLGNDLRKHLKDHDLFHSACPICIVSFLPPIYSWVSLSLLFIQQSFTAKKILVEFFRIEFFFRDSFPWDKSGEIRKVFRLMKDAIDNRWWNKGRLSRRDKCIVDTSFFFSKRLFLFIDEFFGWYYCSQRMNRLGSRILDKMQNILSVLHSYVVIVVIFLENPLLSTNPKFLCLLHLVFSQESYSSLRVLRFSFSWYKDL